MDVKPFYTIKDFSLLIGISLPTLRTYIREYGMPHIQMKKNGNIMINTKRALKWLCEHADAAEANEIEKIWEKKENSEIGQAGRLAQHEKSERGRTSGSSRDYDKGSRIEQSIDAKEAARTGVDITQ